MLRVLRFAVGHAAFGKQHFAFCGGGVDRDEQAAQRGGGYDSDQPLLVELALFLGALNGDQHDHEQEQHHDAAGIKNDLHASDEWSVEHQVEPGLGEQCGDQRHARSGRRSCA